MGENGRKVDKKNDHFHMIILIIMNIREKGGPRNRGSEASIGWEELAGGLSVSWSRLPELEEIWKPPPSLL